MRRSTRKVLLALSLGLGGALLAASGVGAGLEETLGLDTLFRLRGARQPPPEVAIVRLDRDALGRLASLPDEVAAWPEPIRSCAEAYPGLRRVRGVTALARMPRELHACLIDVLAELDARVIAFDIVFAGDPQGRTGNAAIAAASRRAGRVVLVKEALRTQPGITEVPALEPELEAAVAAAAPFTLPAGVRRTTWFWTRQAALATPDQLPLRALEVAAADPARLAAARAEPPVRWFDLYGPPGTIHSVSAAELLLPERAAPVPAVTSLAGRAVFVGAQELTIPGAGDTFPTAFTSAEAVRLSGAELAATAFANLARGEHVVRLPEGIELLLVAALGAGLTAAAAWRGIRLGAGVAVAGASIYAAAAVGAFVGAGLWLPLATPLVIILPAALAVGQLVRYERAARWLTTYVPDPIGALLLRGRERTVETPVRCVATVMITDIAGFSTFSERHSSEAVRALLNDHFTLLSRLIQAETGTVNNTFVGDSMTAFWGAPLPQPDHAARACRAALAIAQAVRADNARRRRAGLATVRLRIGINTGEVTACNIGAPGRSSYSVVGDTPNTAQRIEQLGKLLAEPGQEVTVLVGAATRDAGGDGLAFADAGHHRVPGRERPVRVFRLLTGGEAGALDTVAA